MQMQRTDEEVLFSCIYTYWSLHRKSYCSGFPPHLIRKYWILFLCKFRTVCLQYATQRSL